jgi:hypothetical protein
MDPAKRIVTQLPLPEMWDARGPLPATRQRALAADEVAAFLVVNPLLPSARFVIADVGQPLHWLDLEAMLVFWREIARTRIVAPAEQGFRLEEFPGAFCYLASEWREEGTEAPIVVLEQYH